MEEDERLLGEIRMSGESLALTQDTSRELTGILIRQSAELDGFLNRVQTNISSEDFDAARRIVGKILGEVFVSALYPIFEKYPELKPDGFP